MNAMQISRAVRPVRLFIAGVSLFSVIATVQAGIGGTDRAVRSQVSQSADLDVIGLVQSSDKKSSSLTVSGQTIHIASGTKFVSEKQGGQSGAPAKNSLVAVYGTLNTDGSISASVIESLAQSYIPGATTLFVRGIVTSVNASLATAKIGGLTVDYSSSLYDPSMLSVGPGSLVAFSGVQSSSAVLYSSSATRLDGTLKSSTGIGGTDITAKGIGGTDVQTLGIGGTDKALKVNGIGGTDITAKGIGGTDVQMLGIGGTDKALKVNGIGGTD